MNKVILTGRLTKECEISSSEYVTSYLRNSLAIKKNFKNKNGEYDTEFYDFVAFGKTADYLANYCGKGDLILINGHLSTSKITNDKQQVITSINIVCDEVEILAKVKKDFEIKAENRLQELKNQEKIRNDFLNLEIKNDISADDLPF